MSIDFGSGVRKKVSGTVLFRRVSALHRPLGQKETRNVARAAFEGNHATPSDTSRIGRLVKRRHCARCVYWLVNVLASDPAVLIDC